MAENPMRTSDEECDPIVWASGQVLMVLPVSKECAREIVAALRADEERSAAMYDTPDDLRNLFDWHFAAGRAVFKSLTRSQYALAKRT